MINPTTCSPTTLCTLCTLCEKIFCKLSTRLLSPILTTRRWYRRRRDNATNTRARKKNFHALFSQNFSRSPSPKRLRNERANITPEQKAWAWGEGWRTREARQTKVEWPFAKLLDRKREIGCNPCAANRKCRTNIFVPFLFPFPLSARVFLLSPPLPLLPRQISSVTPLFPLSLVPLDPLIGNHCHAANCQPVVHRIGSGANALSPLSEKHHGFKGVPLNPQSQHLQHFPTSLIASYHAHRNIFIFRV